MTLRGKFLLTGEYAILDGAWGLALPVKYGQTFWVEQTGKTGQLHWISREADGSVWLEAAFDLTTFEVISTNDASSADRLSRLLQSCRQLDGNFASPLSAFQIEMKADFPRQWGLGSSSTLVAAVAQWAGVDAWQLLDMSFGGSGYDIACAFSDTPLLYRRVKTPEGAWRPEIRPVAYQPAWSDQLYFVYLGQKQDSRQGIGQYRRHAETDDGWLEAVSEITMNLLEARDLTEFENLLRRHETLIAQRIGLPRAQDLYFSDWPGVVKSLGAWGGDFVWATSPYSADETRAWFSEKGFPVCFRWNEMVITPTPDSNDASSLK